jgi:glycine/D-amino acid oxidase-like deaminating enzyme
MNNYGDAIASTGVYSDAHAVSRAGRGRVVKFSFINLAAQTARRRHDEQVFKRHIYANRLAGIQNEWLTPDEAKAIWPPLNIDRSSRYPIVGAAFQRLGMRALFQLPARRRERQDQAYVQGGRKTA